MRHSCLAGTAFLLAAALLSCQGPSAADPSGAAAESPKADTPANTTKAPSEWLLGRGDGGQLGVATGTLPSKFSVKWEKKLGDSIPGAVVVKNGIIYAAMGGGTLVAVKQADGEKVWSVELDGGVEGSPAIVGDVVTVGTTSGTLFGFGLAKGDKKWEFASEEKITGSVNAVTVDGKTLAVFGSHDFNVYAIDTTTGKSVWSYATENYVNGTPAVSNGKVIAGGCDAGLHVVDAKTGKEDTIVGLPTYIPGSCAVAWPLAYVAHHENEMLCVNLKTDETVWAFDYEEEPFFSTPAIGKDLVVFGGRDGYVHCVNRKDGKSKWHFETQGNVDSSPLIVGDKVVVGSEDGFLYILKLNSDKEGGEKVWSYETGSSIIAAPVFVDNQIFIGSLDGTLYCIGE